jgi:hypothetical protein
MPASLHCPVLTSRSLIFACVDATNTGFVYVAGVKGPMGVSAVVRSVTKSMVEGDPDINCLYIAHGIS